MVMSPYVLKSLMAVWNEVLSLVMALLMVPLNVRKCEYMLMCNAILFL